MKSNALVAAANLSCALTFAGRSQADDRITTNFFAAAPESGALALLGTAILGG